MFPLGKKLGGSSPLLCFPSSQKLLCCPPPLFLLMLSPLSEVPCPLHVTGDSCSAPTPHPIPSRPVPSPSSPSLGSPESLPGSLSQYLTLCLDLVISPTRLTFRSGTVWCSFVPGALTHCPHHVHSCNSYFLHEHPPTLNLY